MVLATAGMSRSMRATYDSHESHDDGGHSNSHNVARPERLVSVALGTALITLGIRRRDATGVAAALIGGALVHRGATGNCMVYRALGVSTDSADGVLESPRPDVTGRAATVNARNAIKVERTVTIQRARSELYAFWRNFENLPRFMEHLISVQARAGTRSHWIAKAPGGGTVEWDAEVVNDIPDELIAWKSVNESDVPNAGAVNFSDAPGGRGTIVKVTLDYEPPGGRVGNFIARLFGEDPDRQVREDLRKFKQLMEVGEITTSARRVEDSAYVGSTPRK
jgi:uncharacterized membrane protein